MINSISHCTKKKKNGIPEIMLFSYPLVQQEENSVVIYTQRSKVSKFIRGSNYREKRQCNSFPV